MPATIVYLVRHGVTRSNREKVYAGWSEEELTKEGAARRSNSLEISPGALNDHLACLRY